jgi:2-polyprenyl-3-methyl-5-hydroxy-6-metoxy-1,4-benzoquinol methylase
MDHSWIMMLVLGMGGLASIITMARLSIRSFFVARRKIHRESAGASIPRTRGAIIRWPRIYTLILKMAFRGKEPELRRLIADLAQLRPGEAVLDVGCGTGTLALEVCERVGITGRVYGIDPSQQMIAYARRKAAERSLSVNFQLGVVEQLAFPDHSFDVVLCTWMIHHLPIADKQRGLAEIARVLKPGGRLLLVDSHLDDLPLPQGKFSRSKVGDFPIGLGFGFALERRNPVPVSTQEEQP